MMKTIDFVGEIGLTFYSFHTKYIPKPNIIYSCKCPVNVQK